MPSRDRDWERFRVIEQLGVGAFGRTLLVADTTRHDREVVIKVPHDKRTEEALINDLMNAAALTASLTKITHPNIVRCLGFGKFEGFYVMILEYVKGRDLRHIIGPPNVIRRPMEIDRARRIFGDVCAGLCSAHGIHLVHRDIKPDNIMIRDEDGLAKILDFGLSTIIQSSSMEASAVAGTYPYMAPEAFAGKASYASDLWSLAVTLYEIVTGRLPFWDPNPFALRLLIDTTDPVPPSTHNPRVDAALEAIIMRGLEKNRRRRFVTAKEMLDALEPGVETVPPQTPEPPPGPGPAQTTAAEAPESELAAIRTAFLEGSGEQAVGRAQALLDRYPEDPRAFLLVGELFNRLQQWVRAEATVRRGIGVCPDHAGLHFYLAPALWNQGGAKRREAIRVMERALELGLAAAQERQARNLLKAWRTSGGGT